jgi:hypothetical protein
MGECAFGRGFGSVAPDTKPEPGFDEEAWKQIPHVIFDGLRQRYMVRVPESVVHHGLRPLMTISELTPYKLVYVKRTLRKLGINIKFDWPASMVRVCSCRPSP